MAAPSIAGQVALVLASVNANFASACAQVMTLLAMDPAQTLTEMQADSIIKAALIPDNGPKLTEVLKNELTNEGFTIPTGINQLGRNHNEWAIKFFAYHYRHFDKRINEHQAFFDRWVKSHVDDLMA